MNWRDWRLDETVELTRLESRWEWTWLDWRLENWWNWTLKIGELRELDAGDWRIGETGYWRLENWGDWMLETGELRRLDSEDWRIDETGHWRLENCNSKYKKLSKKWVFKGKIIYTHKIFTKYVHSLQVGSYYINHSQDVFFLCRCHLLWCRFMWPMHRVKDEH